VVRLSPEEELTLTRQVQELERLRVLRLALHPGKTAKQRLIQANLRPVVSMARRDQQRGLELLDLVQEGSLGLERGVERFNPTQGIRFSTDATGWIRQGITRALASQNRTIRQQQAALAQRLGCSLRLAELSSALGLSRAKHARSCFRLIFSI
jgi:RNA polymerase nonessential primary-like sigma factor